MYELRYARGQVSFAFIIIDPEPNVKLILCSRSEYLIPLPVKLCLPYPLFQKV